MEGANSEDSTSRFETDPQVADQAIQHQEETMYACTICLHTATHPVVSTCGHLFCWECLFTWLQGHPRPCPVCRTNLTQGVNIIPVFTFTGADVDENPAAGEPQSNTVNATMIPQRPPPPSPDRRLGRIPLPSPVGAVTNTVDDLNSRILEDVGEYLRINFEITREQVDSLEQSVQDLVQRCLMLRQENDRNVQQIDLMNRRHAQEIEAIHRQYAEEMERMRHIQSHARV